jgi:TetR/AcrR family transcriptional repressor of nem operon
MIRRREMRYDANRKLETRRKVLAEAARSIREQGPHQISVADVMSAVGLTHGGFYAHFPSKDALVAAAIEEMFSDMHARFARSTDGYSPADGMARHLDFYLSARHRDARGTGCPLPALSADLARLGPEARARYGEGVASLTHRLSEQIRTLGLEPAEPLALSVLAELVGALSLSRAVGDPAQSDALLAASRDSLKRRLGLERAG